MFIVIFLEAEAVKVLGPPPLGSSFELQLIENNNVNDSNAIRNVLNDKRLIKSVVLFFSSLLHKNLSPC